VVLAGVDESGTEVTFGCDHRMAEPIIGHLVAAQEDDFIDPPVAEVEAWAILSRSKA
jgi:hypothetical protein